MPEFTQQDVGELDLNLWGLAPKPVHSTIMCCGLKS